MKNLILLITAFFIFSESQAQQTVKVGLNYPETGPYSVQGLDQLRAAQLAIEEINASGGILGKQVELVTRDSQSKPILSTENVIDLIDKEGVSMIFGGSSSGVAVAVGDACYEKNTPFFATLTYSTATTGKNGHRTTFRECYDAWAGAKAIADYLNKNYAGKKYYYITADYTWGWTTEDAVRKLSNTTDKNQHKGMLTPFPNAQEKDFKRALSLAKVIKPDVLVLVLFGKDMSETIRLATTMGIHEKTQIVVPNLTLGMAEAGGAKVMEGVIGAVPWTWQIPYQYNYARGKQFVETFATKYNRYPSSSGASAYTIMYEYKAAVERAKSFATSDVIKNLEGHKYTFLKDEQIWRDFDHQSVQTVYAVRCKPATEVAKDKFKLDYFEILSSTPGTDAFISQTQWKAARTEAGRPEQLEPLRSTQTTE